MTGAPDGPSGRDGTLAVPADAAGGEPVRDPDHPPARERLIEAALEMFGTVGYEATTVQALCQRARVSTRDFYRHVGDRLELVRILLEREIEQVHTPLLAAFQSAPPQWHVRARLWIDGWFRRMLEDPRRFRVLYSQAIGVDANLDRRRQQLFRKSVELGAEQMALCAAARGAPHPAEHYEVVTYAILGATRELVARYMAGDLAIGNPDELVDDVVRLAAMLGEQW